MSDQTLDWITLIEPSSEPHTVIIETSEPHTQLNHLTAVRNTVRHICENYPKPIRLMCTSGVDSQSMIWAFSEYAPDDIEIEIHSFVYNNKTNWYDVSNLSEYAEHWGFDLYYHDFDLLEFLDSGDCRSIQEAYQTRSPQIASHIKFLQQFQSGTNIQAGEIGQSDRLRIGFLGPEHVGMIRFAKHHNTLTDHHKVVPFFFISDSQIARSVCGKYTQGNKLRSAAKKYFPESEYNGYIMKCTRYKHLGYDIVPQDQKYTGFEEFKDLYDEHHKATPQERLKASQISNILGQKLRSTRAFDIHHRYLPDFVIRQRSSVQFNPII